MNSGANRSFLLVTSSYPPVLGGSEVEAQRVCAELLRRGWNPLVLCPGGPPMPALSFWLDPFGVPVRLLGRFWPARWRGYYFALAVLFFLWRKRASYSTVYFLMPGLHAALGIPFSSFLGYRVFMKFSGANEIRKLLPSPAGRLTLRSLRRRHVPVMVLNPEMFQEATDAGLLAQQLLWMPNPVDMAAFQPPSPSAKAHFRSQLGLPPAGPIVLFAGRLAPEKELPTLLLAFARAAAVSANLLLVLAGDGPQRQLLQDLAAELRISAQVRFPGMIPPAQIHAYFQAADIFVLASSLEGFPVSLLEAMASGLAVAVSDISANTQLVQDHQNGLLFPVGAPEKLSACLTQLADDPDLRRRLGAAARQSVENQYSLERIAQRYEALLLPSAPPQSASGSAL